MRECKEFTCICHSRFWSQPEACADYCPGPDSRDVAACHCVDLLDIKNIIIYYKYSLRKQLEKLTNITGRIHVVVQWAAGTALAIQIIGSGKGAMIVGSGSSIVMGLTDWRQWATTVREWSSKILIFKIFIAVL